MKRKEFNRTLLNHGWNRESRKDEYGDYIYHYTHPELKGVEIKQSGSEVCLVGSNWTYTKLLEAATILVGAVTLGQSAEEFRAVWGTLIERW